MAGEHELGTPSARPGSSQPPSLLRLAVALADPERERALQLRLAERGEFAFSERCLTAEALLSCVRRGQVDALLVTTDLHHLTDRALQEVASAGIPVVLLARQGEVRAGSGIVLPFDASPEDMEQALRQAVENDRPAPILHPPAQPERSEPAPEPGESPSTVLAFTGGAGSPGRTTVAISLAAALGTVAPTLLLDADLLHPSGVAHLDADPTRNLYMLALANPDTLEEWQRVLDQEVQPLAPRSPQGAVLCGLPKPELRSSLSSRFLERLLAELRRRYRYVLLDTGADLLAENRVAYQTLMALADELLLVATADLVGLWQARQALRRLRQQGGVARDHPALVLNRYDRRYHHPRAEIEWALGLPVAAVIPYDHRAAEWAVAAQRPLVLDERSRAAHALLDLAERLHQGQILLPPEPQERETWLRRLARWRLGSKRISASPSQGGHDGNSPVPTA